MENPEKLTVAKLIRVLKDNGVQISKRRYLKSYYVDLYRKHILKSAEFSSEEDEKDDLKNKEKLSNNDLSPEPVLESTKRCNLVKIQDSLNEDSKRSAGFSDGECDLQPVVRLTILNDIEKYNLRSCQVERERKKLNKSENVNSKKEFNSIKDNIVTTNTPNEDHVINESFEYEKVIAEEQISIPSARKRNVAAFTAKTEDTPKVKLNSSDFSVCGSIRKFIFFLFIIIITFLMFILIHDALEMYAKEMEMNISN